MRNRYFSSILLILGMVSCTSTPFNPPTATVTHTPTPSSTSTPSITPTATFTITSSPTFNPYGPVIDSPNGEFSARKHVFWDGVLEYDKPVIEILDQTGTVVWEIPYQREWNSLNPIIGLVIYGWSPDSSKLYFYYDLYYDTGLPTLGYVRNLQSIEINSGQIKYVLPIPVDAPTAFSFTPDMNQIAFISGNMLSILDLSTGREKRVDILTDDFSDAGWVYYSPNGKRLIYHTMVSENAYAILVNPQTMEQKIVFQWTNFSIGLYEFDGWSSDEYPRYIDYWKNISVLNLNTLSQVSIGTITPTP